MYRIPLGSGERKEQAQVEVSAAASDRRPSGDRKLSSGGGGGGSKQRSPRPSASTPGEIPGGGATGRAGGGATPVGGAVGGTPGTPTKTTQPRKRSSMSGSKEEPEGVSTTPEKSHKDSTPPASAQTKKPSTKAERRALQV